MTPTAFRIVLICQEMTRPAQVRRALEGIPSEAGSEHEFSGFTTADVTARAEDVERAVAAADLVMLSHILVDGEAARVGSLLDRALRPDAHVLAMSSLREILLRTRLGAFRLGGSGPPPAPLARLLGADDMTEAIRELRESLPRLAAAIPPHLSDVRTYLEAHLYWTEPTPANTRALILMLEDRLGPRPGSLTDRYDAPESLPRCGLWHPAVGITEDLGALPSSGTAGRVAVLLMRGAVLAGETAGAEAVVEALAARDIAAVPMFCESFDYREALDRFAPPGSIDGILSISGFPLVGGHNRCASEDSREALAARDVPYFTPANLMVQDEKSWRRSTLGLSPIEVAMQTSMHELEGGLEPLVLQGAAGDGERIAIEDRVDRLADRVAGWLRLRTKPNAEKRIVLTIFSFPPGKGSVGTAAYLDVMESTMRVLGRLRDEGYAVEMPESAGELLERIVSGDDMSAPHDAAQLAVGARLTVAEYERLVPEHARVTAQWGPAPGRLNTDGRDLLIHGVDLGGVFVAVQPSFGYEGDPMQLLFSHGATPHHGFVAFYRWAEHVFGADAIVHVGTHGAMEFMPGKQVGLSGSCWPDRLIGSVPDLYLYAINNPSEGTIAKRRGHALTIGHLTPPADAAGLYRELAEMKAMLSELREAEGGRRQAVLDALVEKVRAVDLDTEVALPQDAADEDGVRRFCGELYVALIEVETRRIPVGLHTIGTAPPAEERVEVLAAMAEHDREELGLPSFPRLWHAAHGRDVDMIGRAVRERDPEAVRAATACGEELRAIVAKRLAGEPTPPAEGIDATELDGLLAWLARVDETLDRGDELGALVRGLAGRHVAPGPGGDPVRAPEVLPAARNIHALDPGSVPSPAAMRHASHVVDLLLERRRHELGRLPRCIGLVLWGLDNIKTHGEAIAQAFLLLGVRPVKNSIGRMSRLEMIPLEELGRPRIDVVMQTSGIFRDIFGLQMQLLDRAVRLVASLDEPDEMNPVRARVRALTADGVNEDTAASRVFSNAPGAYGANIDHMVAMSRWEERSDLADLFVRRKGFALTASGETVEAPEVLRALAGGIDTTFQNLDSSEVSISDVDHYFEYLGGLTSVVEQERGTRPDALLADTTTAVARVRSLEETVRLESRTKLLNPKWYEGMLRHGYEGVEEIRKRLDYTFGWSATCEAVDGWVYRQAHRTFVEDADVRERMVAANVHAARGLVERLLEADSRGFWRAAPEERAALEELSEATEDAIEGVS